MIPFKKFLLCSSFIFLSVSTAFADFSIRMLRPDRKPEPVYVQMGDGEGANYGVGTLLRDAFIHSSKDWSSSLLHRGDKLYVLEGAVFQDASDENLFRRYTGVVISKDGTDCKIPLITQRIVYTGPCSAGWVYSGAIGNIIP